MDSPESGLPILCPWETRRERSDLVWQYVMAHIIAFAAYGHFYHSVLGVRSWGIFGALLLAFAAVPTLPMYTLPLQIEYALYLAQEKKPARLTLEVDGETTVIHTNTRDLRIILSNSIGVPWLLKPTSYRGDQTTHCVVKVSRHRFSISEIGFYILTLASLTQVSGSLIRCMRRLNHESSDLNENATIRADDKVFWLSFSSLFVLVQTLTCALLGNLTWPKPRGALIDWTDVLVVPFLGWMLSYLFGTGFIVRYALLRDRDQVMLWSETNLTIVESVPASVVFYISICFLGTWCFQAFYRIPAVARYIDGILRATGLSSGRATFLSFAVVIGTSLTINSLVLDFLEIRDAFGTSNSPVSVYESCPQLWKDPLWLPAF